MYGLRALLLASPSLDALCLGLADNARRDRMDRREYAEGVAEAMGEVVVRAGVPVHLSFNPRAAQVAHDYAELEERTLADEYAGEILPVAAGLDAVPRYSVLSPSCDGEWAVWDSQEKVVVREYTRRSNAKAAADRLNAKC